MSIPWLLGAALPGSAAEKIPDLYPPEDLIQPGFWERQGGLMALAALVLLAAGWFIFLWLRRPRPVVEEPAGVRARRALRELSLKPEDGLVAGQVSRVMRKYLPFVVTLPSEELTTEETAWHLRQEASLEQDLEMKIVDLLRLCDTIKFSSAPPKSPANLAARALALVDKLEARREEANSREPAGQAAVIPAGEPQP